MGKSHDSGRKVGSGRKIGDSARLTNETREAAMRSGMLPHEWLLKVSRGEPITHTYVNVVTDDHGNIIAKNIITDEHYATWAERIDCAKAAAGYYAPKLAAQMVQVNEDKSVDFLGLMQSFSLKLPG